MNARESKKSEKLSDNLVISSSGALAVGGAGISGSVALSASGALTVGVATKRGVKRVNKLVNPSILATEMVNEAGAWEVYRSAYKVCAAPGAIVI